MFHLKRKHMKILILCTGNTCRSQMAEGFLKTIDPSLEVYSAGTEPGERVHPVAIEVMKEKGIDLGRGVPKPVEQFVNTPFDYVITVCDGAKEACPVFTGKVKHRLHIGFDDPAEATGTPQEIKKVFLRVRDEIERDFTKFYNEQLKR
jgi:arsenate reductase